MSVAIMPITKKIATEALIPFLLVMVFISVTLAEAEQLQSSQAQTLLRIQNLLNYPPFLSNWKNGTDFCNTEPTTPLTLVCYQNSLTQLHIIGEEPKAPPLPQNFSIDSFFTTLVKLPSLKVLKLVNLGLWGSLPSKFTRLTSLEILNLTENFFQGNIPPSMPLLTHLQTLILDSNNFTGTLPKRLGSLSALAVLSVKNNSLYGSLPHSLASLENLRVLVLSNNNFSGEVPDLRNLRNLQTIDLGNNVLGPRFPVLGSKIESIVLENNRFTFGIPKEVESYYQLKLLDISFNRFVGPFPVSLLSLQSLAYLDIAGNKFTGMLFENLPCNDELVFVNLTSNLLTGKLPSCFGKRIVLYGENCLETGEENQHPVSFCKREAVAVGILMPRAHKRKQESTVILSLSICGGIIGGIVLVSAALLVVKNILAKRERQKPQPRFVADQNPSTSYTSKLLKDARYITQAMKVGALGIPAYRTFSLEELEQATNNFATSAFMGEGSHGQMYRGQLRDGSYVAIRCLKLKRNHNTQYFMTHIEMISKLRHRHLVSALGHCFECYLDDSSVSRVFLVFEYVPNGTLRTWVSERGVQQKLTWAQRIAVATGIAKGIQFLHAGIVPGLFSNNLRITDVLLDQNLLAKVSSYNLPLLAENMGRDRLRCFLGGSKESKSLRANDQDKSDVYDFGVILLEVISGKPINSRNEIEVQKDQVQFELQASTIADYSSKKSVDPAVKNTCSGESLKTMLEICYRCLVQDPGERPSIEDVLWNLQFAAQVQDAWRGDSQSSDASPISPLQSTSFKLTIK